MAQPTLTLSMNANEVVANTLAGNQIFRATCPGGDTCNIKILPSNNVVASGTTTTTYGVNEITVTSANSFYASLYANDGNTDANSVVNTIRILPSSILVNSTSLTFNNTFGQSYQTGTTMELILSNYAFKQWETSCNDNNQVIFNPSGVVQVSQYLGNQSNESNVNSCTAPRAITLLSSTTGFLSGHSTNTLEIGWAPPGTNLYDGNYICEAPQLSSTYGIYDCGSKVFQNYYTGGGGSGGTIESTFTNNAFSLTYSANYIVGTCSSTWCFDYISTPATMQSPNNGFMIFAANTILSGTTNSVPTPDGLANQSIEEGSNCDPSNPSTAICINIGGGFGSNAVGAATTNSVPFIYSFQPGIWEPSNSSNIIAVYRNDFTNLFSGMMMLDNCQNFNGCNGGSNPPQNPIVGNTLYGFTSFAGLKGLIAPNFTNITGIINIAKKDNFTSKDVIWIDPENFSYSTFPYYEVVKWAPLFTSECDIIHAAGYKAGIYLLGDTPIGEFDTGYLDSGWMNNLWTLNMTQFACADYINVQDQFYIDNGAGSVGNTGASTFANAIILNVTASNTPTRVSVQATLINEGAFDGTPLAPLANSIVFAQIRNYSLTLPQVDSAPINYLLAGQGCRLTTSPKCTPNLLSNDINYSESQGSPFDANSKILQLYQLAAMGKNTTLQYDNQFVQDRTGTSGINSPYFGFWLNSGKSIDVGWIGTEILPPNDIQPVITLGTSGVLTTPYMTANYPTVGTSAGHIIFIGNWTGGEGPYTVNIIIANSISGAVLSSSSKTNWNATYYVYNYSNAARVPIMANILVSDANGNSANSPEIYLPPSIAIANSVIYADAGQAVQFYAETSGGALLYNAYNALFQISNSVTDITMNTIVANNILRQPIYAFSNTIPAAWVGNTISANIILRTGYIPGNYMQQSPIILALNSTRSSAITINAQPLSDAWSVSNNPVLIGDTQVFTATLVGGTPDYQYKYSIYNSLGLCLSTTYSNVALTTNTFTWTVNGICGTGAMTANILITDSATMPDTTSNTLTFTINNPTPPSLLLANSTNGNMIDIRAGSASDNALITATASSGDTVGIQQCGTSTTYASGTTTASAAYNSLPMGYTCIYANDITVSLTSADALVRRIQLDAITVTYENQQDVAVEANTPLSFVYNALAYQNWESNTLNNTAVYFKNGTIAYSWIEGNASDEQQDANTLYTSNSVLFWFRSPPSNSFLTANTGITPTNAVYLGFSALPGNSLLDGNVIGEAPQLSCANPTNTINCYYGEYDNGNAVFSNYTNFMGSSLPNGWTYESPPSGSSFYVDNSLFITLGSTTWFYIVSNTLASPGNTVDWYLFQNSGLSGTGSAEYGWISLADVEFGIYMQCIDGFSSNACRGQNYNGGGQNSQTSAIFGELPQYLISSVNYYTSANAIYVMNYTYDLGSLTTDFPSGNMYVGMWLTQDQSDSIVRWERVRIDPPNSIMPSYTLSPASDISAYVAWTASNSILDIGQDQRLTAGINYAVSPYSYNILVYNAIGSLVYNSLSPYINPTTNSIFFTQSGSWGSGTFTANVYVTDSESQPVTVGNSLKYTVYNALSVPALTGPVTLDSDQSTTITASWSGGYPAYNAIWYSGSSSSCGSDTSIIGLYNGIPSTSNQLTVSPTSNTYYCMSVSDNSLAGPVTEASSTVLITVNPALQTPTISASPTTINPGQSSLLTASWSGGSPTYTVTWYSGTSSSCNFDNTELAQYVALPGTSNQLSISPSATRYYCIVLKDSASSPVTLSSGTVQVSVNSNLEAGAITPGSESIDLSQGITLTSDASGGSPPYTISWYGQASCAGSALGTGTSYTPSPASNTVYSYGVMDSLSSSACSSPVTITVSSAPLSAGASTPASQTINEGQSVTLTANPSGGTLPYSYQWYTSSTSSCTGLTKITGATSATYSASPSTSTLYCYQATDSAYSAVTATPTQASDITVVGPFLGTPVYFENSTSTITLYSNGIIAGIPSCAANTLGGNCLGNDLISGTHSLRNNLFVYGNLTIASGSTLSANGFYMGTNGTFNSLGATIDVGYAAIQNCLGGNGGNGASSGNPTQGNGINGCYATNAIMSYGGSGGGGGGGGGGGATLGATTGYGGSGGTGGNTIGNGGNGGTPGTLGNTGGNGGSGSSGTEAGSPTLTAANVMIYCESPSLYLAGTQGGSGAGGGGGDANTGAGYTGGNGGNGANSTNIVPIGTCISGNRVILGTINANGISGTAGSNGGTGQSDSGGGGGGGASGGTGGAAVIIANGIGGYVAGTYNTVGGLGGISSSGGSAGGGNGGNGGSGGNGGPGQIDRFMFGSQGNPLSGLVQYYPYKIYTISAGNTVLFTLTSTFQGNTNTIESNVMNVTHIPLPSATSGLVQYTISQASAGNTINVMVNVSRNMTNIKSAFTFNIPILQYLPNFAYCPSWSAIPSTWEILGDVQANQYPNQSNPCGDRFSNANLTYAPQIQLTYNSFSPAYSFTINAMNNPQIGKISQTSWQAIASNAVPSSPYTRNAVNISSYDQQFLSSLDTTTTFTGNYFINNYTIGSNTLSFTGNQFTVFIPLSNYINPILTIKSPTVTSLAASHSSVTNNFCNAAISYGNPQNYGIYLPNNANSTSYSVTISRGFSAGDLGGYIVSFGGTPQRQEQQLLIGSNPFGLILQVNQPYQFELLNGNCQLIYTSPLSIWPPSTITFNLNVSNAAPSLTIPSIQNNCSFKLNSTTSNLIFTCSGVDTNNVISFWNITIDNASALQQPAILASVIRYGSAYNYTIGNLPQNAVITAVVQAFDPSNGVSGSIYSYPYYYGLQPSNGFQLQSAGFIAILFYLIGIGAGAFIAKQNAAVAIPYTLYIEAGITVFLYISGVTSTLGLGINGAIIVVCVLVGLLTQYYQGKGSFP